MRNALRTLCATAALTASLALPAFAQSQEAPRPRPIAEVNANALVNQTQVISDDPDRFELVWWMPPEFWQRSLLDSDVGAGEREEMIALFSKYVVVAVVKGDLGDFGMKNFANADTLRRQLRLLDADGTRVAPLPQDDLEAELAILFTVMRPVMASFIGPAGENMQMFAFPGRDRAGKPRADALAAGTVRFDLDGVPFTFETPLPSLLMPMVDGATGQEFPGTYRFNPYTGAPLQATPAKKK